MNETWRPIPGFEPMEASTEGRIRNAATGRIRLARPNHSGYLVFRPFFRTTPKLVHRLVALAHLGPCPEGYTVDHVDCDKLNNRPRNLEYVTRRENVHRAIRAGLWDGLVHVPPERVPRGERHFRARLTESAVLSARARYASGVVTLRELARELGVSEVTIREAVRGRKWAHLPGAVPFNVA